MPRQIPLIKDKNGVPIIVVDAANGEIMAPDKVHAAPRSNHGRVRFIASEPCTLMFTDPSVFGQQQVALNAGDTLLDVAVESGTTDYGISGAATMGATAAVGTSRPGASVMSGPRIDVP